MVTRQEYAKISHSVYGNGELPPGEWKLVDLNGELTTEYIDSGNGFQGAYYVLGLNIFVRS